jgi:sugar lactone lactonase YvrE
MTTCVSSHQTTWDQNGGDLLCYFDSTGDYQWAFAHDPAVLNTPKLLAIDSIDSFAPAAGTYGVAIPGIVTASAYNSPESWAGSNPGNLSANGNWTWTGYIVNNASTGAFLIKLNAGSSGTTNTADIYVDGGLVGTIAIPNTGSSGTYQDSATLSISTLAAGTHGVLLKASSGSCGVNTIIITSDATAAPAFTTQPAGQTVAAGGTATFMAAASGNPAPTYQWQLSTAGGNTWTNLTEAAPYSGTATATLTITSATMAMNGYQYQCQASNSVRSNVASNTASLIVIPAAVTLGVPGSVFASGFTAVWGSVSGATGYRLDVSTNSSFSSFVSGYQNLDVGDVTSVALSGLSASTTYYCRVRAYASAGTGANSSTVTVTTTANIVISAPLTVSTLAGQPLSSGSSDGTGNAARFYYPSGIAADTAGNLYLADIDNHMIRKIVASTGSVTTLAGLAGNSGSTDGTGSDARFNSPSGVTVDGAGNVYVADTMNNTLRKVTASGVVSTLAGSPGIAGSVDGTGSAALFHGPQGLAIDSSRNLYVADTNNQTIRKVVPSTGVVTTVAGLAGNPGSADGMVDLARFNYPSGIAVDGNGNLYVADTDNHTIRLISVLGLIASPLGLPGSTVVSTLAGLSGNSGGADGTGSTARFNSPSDLAVDSSGNLYVADTENFTIREVLSPSGAVSTLAGLAETSGSTDGLGSAVRFFHPAGIALDNSRNLYVADTDNHTVRVGLLAIAPAIQTQPQSQTVTAGNSVQFTVTASGRPAVTSYQWYFNGMAIGGATSTTYNLSNAQSGNAGNYTVVVSNVVNSVTSNAAILTVNAVTPPPSGGGSGSGGGGGAPSVWFYGTLSLLALARRMLRRQ